MSQYAQIVDGAVAAIVDIPAALAAGWAADGNPKALAYRPLVMDTQPVPSASQVVTQAGYVIEAARVRQTWALRAKTQAEIDASDDAADSAMLKASQVVSLLKAEIAGTSSLTAAQFRALAARVLLYLVRKAIGGA